MKTSDRGVIALIGHEGIVPGPYLDSVKVLTYGVGHTAAAGAPDPAKMPVGMPDNLDAELQKVFRVFRQDLVKYEAEVARAIKVPVSQHEFDAAVSFHFNTGAIGRAQWVKSLNSGHRDRAGVQIMNWSRPREIIPRRMAEMELFLSGTYPREGVTVWSVGRDRRVIWRPARVLAPQEALSMLRGAGIPDAPEGPPSRLWWFPVLDWLARLFDKGERHEY